MPLSGIMVGNGCTDWGLDTDSSCVETMYHWNMIPKRIWESYYSNECGLEDYPGIGPKPKNETACNALEDKIFGYGSEGGLVGNLN